MRMSQLFLRTLRDDPADAEVESHRLLVRAGYMRRVAAGIYSWLPLGHRVLANITAIVRREMDHAGAQEVTLPITQPRDLWERSGRDAAYGPLMFRLEDRKGAGFNLAPTAEEVVTTLVGGEYSSYRDLPVNLYQINWKYRDELRPRFGLLRGREFLMKDAYSFDADPDGLRESYRAMYDAYGRIFEQCGLTFRPVEARSGEIGGDVNHEFMAVAAVGEDDFVWCTKCDYAANVEAAVRGAGAGSPPPVEGAAPVEKVHTPGLAGIRDVAQALGVSPSEMLKSIAFDLDGELGLAVVPGDREVNEAALARAVGDRQLRLYGDDEFAARPELPKGYIGPDYEGASLVVADHSVAARSSWATGANEVDHHVIGAVLGRDFSVDVWADLVVIESGDACPRCGGPLSVDRGIEVGHVFQLGTKYSEALGAMFKDESGESHPMLMGCYGIGVSRLVAAVVEEHHDDSGIVWPRRVAPYEVHLISVPGRGENAEVVRREAELVYDEIGRHGISVLYDDRDVSPGVKFADADLLGMPRQVVVGAKGLQRGVVEYKDRRSGVRTDVNRMEILAVLTGAESLPS